MTSEPPQRASASRLNLPGLRAHRPPGRARPSQPGLGIRKTASSSTPTRTPTAYTPTCARRSPTPSKTPTSARSTPTPTRPPSARPSPATPASIPQCIIAGAGADELLDLTLRALLPPDAAIITCSPSFGMYPFLADINQLQLLDIPRGDQFALPARTRSPLKTVAERSGDAIVDPHLSQQPQRRPRTPRPAAIPAVGRRNRHPRRGLHRIRRPGRLRPGPADRLPPPDHHAHLQQVGRHRRTPTRLRPRPPRPHRRPAQGQAALQHQLRRRNRRPSRHRQPPTRSASRSKPSATPETNSTKPSSQLDGLTPLPSNANFILVKVDPQP